MKARTKKKRATEVLYLASLAICFGLLGIPIFAADWEEGGYAGESGSAERTVNKFLDNFVANQNHAARLHQFTYNNDDRVDDMDLAYYCGHGSPFVIEMYYGSAVTLGTAGYSSAGGYGHDLEFLVLHSCEVVPSPDDSSFWKEPWIQEPDDIFDGLHQVLGFRTPASMSTDGRIANEFGERMRVGREVWQSWFAAIDKHGRSSEFGCAVMYPSTRHDKYKNGGVVEDPRPDHTRLYCYWQH